MNGYGEEIPGAFKAIEDVKSSLRGVQNELRVYYYI